MECLTVLEWHGMHNSVQSFGSSIVEAPDCTPSLSYIYPRGSNQPEESETPAILLLVNDIVRSCKLNFCNEHCS